MSWTAVVPIRLGSPRKTRLSECLRSAEREALADRLFEHVAGIVRTHPDINRTVILSPLRPPRTRRESWRWDEGHGINEELAAFRRSLESCNLLVVNADLPLLAHHDLSRLIGTAERHGVAIAPDHRGTGTNALALRAGRNLVFAFGEDSLARHLAAAGASGAQSLVSSPGLACDIDAPEDLAFAANLLAFADHGEGGQAPAAIVADWPERPGRIRTGNV